MLWMVVERFRSGKPNEVGARFKELGRMMPDGLEYVESWMTPEGDACFQIVRGAHAALLEEWMSHWSDLVIFETTPIVPSASYWSDNP